MAAISKRDISSLTLGDYAYLTQFGETRLIQLPPRRHAQISTMLRHPTE